MELSEKLLRIAQRYPDRFRARILGDIPRQAFHIRVLLEAVGANATVVDVGGGTSLFTPGCAAMGMDAILLDDFADYPDDEENTRARKQMLDEVHQPLAVRILNRDVMTEGLGIDPESVDCVTSFAAIEHFHHSPKKLLHEMFAALRPGGLFFLGAPNCVNLRKRLTVPLGFGKWTQMRDWYEREVFRGHVREPDVDDLGYIGTDLGVTSPRIYGRNWIGRNHPNPLIRSLTPLADRLLQLRPSLCSEIYLAGRKPLE